ncbi:MAG: hypothetical protein IBX61_07315 [Thermoleophilia bacterium]|nr:hypothetical protein [Thermoleophilia bacterium]
MATENVVERTAEFEAGIQKWQEIEDRTIALCEEIINSTDNPVVKTMVGVISADSAKHKQILSLITQALEGTVSLAPEELGRISALLDQHMELEKESIDLGIREYENSRHFVIRHLLSYLLQDEQKHMKILNQLNDFKRQLYPYT